MFGLVVHTLTARLQKVKHSCVTVVPFGNSRFWYWLIYLLTAVGLRLGGSSAVHICTKTIHRTTELTTLVGRVSGIRTQSGQTKINDELTA